MASDLWCQVNVVGPDRVTLAAHRLEGPGAPDLGAVDEVARLALLASRLGGYIVLSEVVPALSALLELSGLSVEMERQSEGREKALWIEKVQEELHSRDLPG
jgi:hypothetical protein